jgi:dolichol-phosphate mannosyltransferase
MGTALALAIPAYNEADGIVGFLRELDDCFRDWEGGVTFVVVDDRSTDGTGEVVEKAGPGFGAELRVVTMETNGGHGPAVLRAYREAIATGADLTLQVDGDGQFDGRDVRRVADDLVHSGADVAIAKRRDRRDPWFRKVLTRVLRVYLQQRAGLKVMDPNCPLRAYRSPVLETLLAGVPAGATVPNVYLAVLGDRAGLPTAELIVEHRDRRGDTIQGTTWGRKQRTLAIPKRLVVFVWRAFHECRRFITTLDRRGLDAVPVSARGAVSNRS